MKFFENNIFINLLDNEAEIIENRFYISFKIAPVSPRMLIRDINYELNNLRAKITFLKLEILFLFRKWIIILTLDSSILAPK